MVCRTRIILLALAAVATGCFGRGRSAPAAPPPARPYPPPVRMYNDNAGGIQDSMRLVIRTAQEFREIWTRATSVDPSPTSAPTVDFSEEMVLVVSNGRMATGDDVRVDSAGVREVVTAQDRRQDVLEVIVRTTRACGDPNPPRYPLDIVRVRRYAGDVVWAERTPPPCRDGMEPRR